MDTIKIFSTPHGEFAIDTVADAKMAGVFARGEYHQEDTVELLSAFVTPESIFVDGGAHIGTITIPLARQAARTIAYEADVQTCALLRKNVERNGVSVDVRQKGIGAEAARGEMHSVREGNAGAHTLTVGGGRVEVVALDEDLEKFDVLKLDVEGMELAVLRGAERILKENRPVLLFEVNLSQLRAHGASLRALGSFLRERRYRLHLPFRQNGKLVLGKVASLSLITLLMYPGAFLFRRMSSVFDILALPEEQNPPPLLIVSACHTLAWVFVGNVRDKMRRVQKYFV